MPVVRLRQFIGTAGSFRIFDSLLTIRRAGSYKSGYYPNGICNSSDYQRAQKSLSLRALGLRDFMKMLSCSFSVPAYSST